MVFQVLWVFLSTLWGFVSHRLDEAFIINGIYIFSPVETHQLRRKVKTKQASRFGIFIWLIIKYTVIHPIYCSSFGGFQGSKECIYCICCLPLGKYLEIGYIGNE